MSTQLFAASTGEVNGIYFDAKTGDVTGAKALSDGILNIPESITVDGKKISVTNIAEKAFKWRTDIQEVNFPLSLKSISDGAFEDCISLKSIIIPDNVTKLGYSPFGGCI